MANPGFFNHIDDPDEFWDDEPLVPYRQPGATRQPPASFSSSQNLVTPSASVDSPKVGSSFASMELDGGFLPIRVTCDPRWSRYVMPSEAGEEMTAAYRGAVVNRLNEVYSAVPTRVPASHEVHEAATPPVRTTLMLLLETDTWDQYCAVSSDILSGGRYTAHGRVRSGSQHPVTVVADRRYLCSISISGTWASRAHPDDIGDEIVACADRIRSLRLRFVVEHDYSRYSDDDLNYHLDRHRLHLLQEWVK